LEALFKGYDAKLHYTESLAPFKSLTGFTYPIKPASPLGREDFGLPLDKRLYLCPNQHYKFHPSFDAFLLGLLSPLKILTPEP